MAVFDRDRKQADAWLKESIRILAQVGDRRGLARSLEALAELDLAGNEPERSAAILAAAGSLRRASGIPVPARLRPRVEAVRTGMTEAIGAESAAAIAKRWANASAAEAAALATGDAAPAGQA